MKRIYALATLPLLLLAHPLAAQQPADEASDVLAEAEEALRASGIGEAADSIAAASLPELNQALEALTVALSGIVSRIAGDPELRRSAVRAADGMLGVAQVVLAEQSRVLEKILQDAAEEVREIPIPEPAAP